MNRILELLAKINELTAEERTELGTLLADLSVLTADELVALDTALAESLTELESADPTDDNVAAVTIVADAMVATRTETERRATEASDRERTRQEQIARARGEATDGDGDTPADGDEPPATDDAAPETPAETPAAPAEGDTPAETPAAPEAAAPLPVAASAMAARQRAATPPKPRAVQARVAITAGGDIPGIGAGRQLKGMDEIVDALTRRLPGVRSARGSGESVLVASIATEYPQERFLGSDPDRNAELIRKVTSLDAIVAAGGICAPLEPRYDQVNISTADRPVRDALARFGTTRGGITFMPTPVIGDLSGAVSQWTLANDVDAAPDGVPAKPCLRVACETPVDVNLYAVPLCLTFGNMGARANPEIVRVNTDLAMAAHARFAESLLLAQIATNSTAVTTDRLLGASRDLFSHLDAAAAGMRSRHRMSPQAPLRAIFPFWVRDLIRADLERELAHAGDRRSVTNAEIDAKFSERNVNVTYTLDGPSGQIFDAQAAAADVDPFPTTVVWNLFPEGTHLFLDGGTLDLGLVRDSTLNRTNDYQTFVETFEAVATTGVESLVVTSTVCPDGKSQATVAATLCA